MQHRVDARGDRVAAFRSKRSRSSRTGHGARRGVVGEIGGLFHQRLLQRQKLRQLAGGGLPNRRSGAEVAVLLEQRDAQAVRAFDAPRVGSTSPVNNRKSVVFPEPLRPTMPTVRPGRR